ncbi:hypothetical protein [Heyndrickxia sporothermodurans]|uniref:hypothetical protein n=1 Tax=Heyndrickxia sporothermodurans TaxID=46224 RepID=UPI00082418BE|nr:hypothetical protein [Heyndrickxia sporothermodurans]
MEKSYLIAANIIGILFLLYVFIRAIRISLSMRRCKPIHKKAFRTKGKNLESRIFGMIVAIILIIYISSPYSISNQRTFLFCTCVFLLVWSCINLYFAKQKLEKMESAFPLK